MMPAFLLLSGEQRTVADRPRQARRARRVAGRSEAHHRTQVELKEGEALGKDRRIRGLAFCAASCGASVVIGNFEKSDSVRFVVAIGG